MRFRIMRTGILFGDQGKKEAGRELTGGYCLDGAVGGGVKDQSSR